MLAAGSSLQGSSGVNNYGLIDVPANVAPLSAAVDQGLIYLLLAILFLVFSLFMVHESASIQKKLLREDDNAPDSSLGLIISWLSACGIILFWFYNATQTRIGPSGFDYEYASVLFGLLIGQPSKFIPAFLLAGILPAAIAIYYFSIATFHRPPTKTSNEIFVHRSPISAIVGAVVTIIGLVASVATLISFYETH